MLSPPKDCDLRTRRSSHPFAEARLDGRARRARSRLRDALPGTAQAGARRAPLARPRRPSRHDRARSRKFFAAGGGSQALALEDRRHFFTHAAKVMPSIIVDFAREQLAQRRGGSANFLQLTASADPARMPRGTRRRVARGTRDPRASPCPYATNPRHPLRAHGGHRRQRGRGEQARRSGGRVAAQAAAGSRGRRRAHHAAYMKLNREDLREAERTFLNAAHAVLDGHVTRPLATLRAALDSSLTSA